MIKSEFSIPVGFGAHGVFPHPYAVTTATNIRIINGSTQPIDPLVEAMRKRFYTGLPYIEKSLGVLGSRGRLKECHELMAIGDVFILALEDLAKKFRLDFPRDGRMDRLVEKLQLVLSENQQKCYDLNLEALNPLLLELRELCSESPLCSDWEEIFTPFTEALSKPFGSRLILRAVYDARLKNWNDNRLHKVELPIRVVLQAIHLLSGLALNSYAYFLKEVEQFPRFETLSPKQQDEVLHCQQHLPKLFWMREEMDKWIASEGVKVEKEIRRIRQMEFPGGKELENSCLEWVTIFGAFEERFNLIPHSISYDRECPIPDYLERMLRLYHLAHFLVAERIYTAIHHLSGIAKRKVAVPKESSTLAEWLKDYRPLSRFKVITPEIAPQKKQKVAERPHERLLSMAARIRRFSETQQNKREPLQNALFQMDLLAQLMKREQLDGEAYVEACGRSAWALEQVIKTKLKVPSKIHNLRVLWRRAELGAQPDAIETLFLANHWVRFPFEEVELRFSQSTSTASEIKLPKVLKQLYRLAKGESIPNPERKVTRLVNQTLDALGRLLSKPKKKIPPYALQSGAHAAIEGKIPPFENLRELLGQQHHPSSEASIAFRQAEWHLFLLESATKLLLSAKEAAESSAYSLRALEQVQHLLSELMGGLLSLKGKPIPTFHECGELARLLGKEPTWYDAMLKGVSTKTRYPLDALSQSVAGEIVEHISAFRLHLEERPPFDPEVEIPKVLALIDEALHQGCALLNPPPKGTISEM